MTKEQKIQEAFGKSWSLLSHSIQQHILNVHHWVDRSLNRMAISPLDLGFDEATECEVNCEFWRPIQLKGIENNNGWIKIETEEDLPNKPDELFEVGILDGIGCFHHERKRYAGKSIKWMWNKDLITHYQPIEKPKPPIY